MLPSYKSPRLASRHPVFILQTGDLHARTDPPIGLGIDSDENIAWLQVSTVQIPARVGPGTELEQHRRQPQLRDRGGRRLPLGGQFLKRRADEDANPLIGGFRS